MAKGDQALSVEEVALLELLSDLIERFESRTAETFPESTPLGLIRILVEEHNLQPIEVAAVFGSDSAASDVLSGRRPASSAEARRLGTKFNLAPEAFLA